MNLKTYDYNIITDTLNGKVAVDELVQSINQSNIVIGLNHINIDNDKLYIIFKDELSEIEIMTLTEIINEHDGIKNIKNDPQLVKIIEEDPSGNNKTNGKFQADMMKLNIPSNNGKYTTTLSYKQFEIS